MKKTYVVDKSSVKEGDIAKVLRRYKDGSSLEIEGPVSRIPATGQFAVVANGTTYLVDGGAIITAVRCKRGITEANFISARREVEVPELPTEMGSLIWTGRERPIRRVLVMYTGAVNGVPKPVWYGKSGYHEPGDIGEWQPVTPDTLDAPNHDNWIEAW